MADKVKYVSGATSSFIPGESGETGSRGAVTFYGSYDSSITGNKLIHFVDEKNEISGVVEFAYKSVTPAINDYIIYSVIDKTYLYYIKDIVVVSANEDIEDVDPKYHHFVDVVNTDNSPEWNKVIIDSEEKVLYGKHPDGTEYQPDLSGYNMTYDWLTLPVNSIIN